MRSISVTLYIIVNFKNYPSIFNWILTKIDERVLGKVRDEVNYAWSFETLSRL